MISLQSFYVFISVAVTVGISCRNQFAVSAAEVTAATTTTTTTEQQIISIPLVPHHVQRQRRSLRDDDAQQVLDETEYESDDESYRSHYRRRNRHHRHYHFRRMEEEDEVTLQVGALYQGYGTHYVDLWVGSPVPQRQTVIVDTGSGVTAFPCSGCVDCGESYHIDEYFQESQSETFRKLTCDECTRGSCSHHECRIGMSYQEGSSWSAYEGQDICYAGGPHDEPLQVDKNENDNDDDSTVDDVDPHGASTYAFPLKFGCQTKITGLFKTQLADGIMGMDNASTSYWAQMNKSGKLQQRQFALCYSRQPTSAREGTEAGALTFGGPDTRLHSSPMVYSGGKKGRVGFFSVRMRKVYLRQGGYGDSATASSADPNNNDQPTVVPLDASEESLNRGGIIVDSGTTDTYFTRAISTAFNNAFEELTGRKYGHDPVDLTPAQLDALPTILLQIVGDEDTNGNLYGTNYDVTGLAGQVLDPDHPYDVILAIPPSHYMEYDHKKEKYVARFYTEEGSGSVLGGNAIMGHDVYFDLEGNRIGWAESRCDYTALVAQYDTTQDTTTTPETSEKKETQQPEVPVEEPQEKPDSSHGKPPSTSPLEEPSHEVDEHSIDKPPEVEEDISSDSSIPPILQFCSDTKCRGSLMAALVGVLFVAVFVGRKVASRRSQMARYHGTELEVPTLHLDEDDAVDFSTRYRDHPEGEGGGEVEEDDVAEEGVGYEDDDELEPHEIA